jgi:hypothetical protein
MTVLEVKHLSDDGKVKWEQYKVPNLIHSSGELYCLTALFSTVVTQIPANYYVGLDNRASPAATDTLANLSQEPSQFGYGRQPLSSGTGFVVSITNDGIYQAVSNVLTFSAVSGTWGPVKNVFLATSADNTGLLISTATLDGTHFLNDGEQLTLRIALTLKDVPEGE